MRNTPYRPIQHLARRRWTCPSFRGVATPVRGIAAALALALLVLPVGASPESSSSDAEKSTKVTYTADVAPILNAKCVVCHRQGEIAPMSLASYDEVRPWAKSVRKVVNDRTMPPWHANPDYGSFANDRSLSDVEVDTIDRWVRQGAKQGDPDLLRPPPEFVDGWRLGEPDLVVTFDPTAIPADGPDVFEDLVRDLGLEEDRWLRAIEVRPGDRRVVHHVIVYVLEESGGPPSSGWLGAWAAGMEPMTFPDGTAKLLTTGSKLVADMHFHPVGEEAVDQTRMGLYFFDGEPEKELINLWVQNANFKIPAGANDHEVRSTFTFDQDSTMYGLLPHMHYRGKDFTYTASYPDGSSEILLKVDDYDFNWQTLYQFAEPIKMPEGSRIDCVAHFDNSADNPDNPDPTREVTFGNESYDEMMIGFVDYVVDHGQRPMSAEDRITQILGELGSEHPGKVWSVRVSQGEMNIDTALYFPDEGAGQWFIPINGQVYDGQLVSIQRSGSSYTAKLVAAIGIMDIAGSLEANHMAGTVTLGDQSLSYEGIPATPDP